MRQKSAQRSQSGESKFDTAHCVSVPREEQNCVRQKSAQRLQSDESTTHWPAADYLKPQAVTQLLQSNQVCQLKSSPAIERCAGRLLPLQVAADSS